jgi:uncharacterized protein
MHSNHLINESSPYLLQHAHNPVDWYPWGDEALARAKSENKPILVSIGYAACHWCHVMERESFEDEATAAIMNEHFINIKIDREERPDLDHIYMDAVQAMSGSGGWPLNVFLTPDARPFYGGTYFPPVPAFNRPSWTEVLQSVNNAYRNKAEEIEAQAENLTQHMIQANSFGQQNLPGSETFKKENLDSAFRNIMNQADREWGGFGKAPKFPQTFTINFLLRYHYVTKDKEALEQALLSLDKMIQGGIYDQLGGGFARYSTDTSWLVPHFEKMLYDNALLIEVISDAYLLTHEPRYRKVILETMEFIEREMLHVRKGFYAALDADSEGVEGKFYVWDRKQVEELLGNDAELFCAYYGITEKGNWVDEHSSLEGVNILHVIKTAEDFARDNDIPLADFDNLLQRGRNKLLEKRAERIRPALDDKVILGWNALMNAAASKAFAATGEERYRQLAIDNMEFLLANFSADGESDLFHTWKNEQAKFPAFVDDYAFLIDALIKLYQVTCELKWLLQAKELTDFVVENFSEPGTGFFYYTRKDQEDVIIRKKEVYDGAVPSGNSVMAFNLLHLSIFFDNKEWRNLATQPVSALGTAIVKYPSSFGNWACLLMEMIMGTDEIAVIGEKYRDTVTEILGNFLPHSIIAGASKGQKQPVLLDNKLTAVQTSIWLCRNYTCQLPVFSVEDVITLIDSRPGG